MTGPQLRRELSHRFGFSRFRPHQEQIVQAVLAGEDVFASLPTGGGKSLCYQLPATLLDGLTLVVSPLIALMHDQVDAARENGLRARCLNSSTEPAEKQTTYGELARRELDLLYVSPERLAIPEFRDMLADWGLSVVAVDEAHCISEWGHDFRPDYRNLVAIREEFPSVPIAAFTATATPRVRDDIISSLRLREPRVIRASFDRPEITYRVRRRVSELADVVDAVGEVRGRTGETGIVYRATRDLVERTSDALQASGIPARPYHAGLEHSERQASQRAFVNDEIDVIVATIAFGMGIDKSNVRWVVHGDLPQTVEAYYQQTGRAGRDGEPSEALLLWGPKDIRTIRWHIGRMSLRDEQERAEQGLRQILNYVEPGGCRRSRLLGHFGEEHPGNCGGCDACLGEIELEDVTVPAQMIMSAMVRSGQRFGAHHIVDIVSGNASDKVVERGHDALPTFGVGRDRPRGAWLDLVKDLERDGYIEREPAGDNGRMGGYRVTAAGRQVLSGRQTVLGVRRSPALRGAAGAPAAAAPDVPEGEAEALFNCLRQRRRSLARERSVPPYVVFSDRSLRDMARLRPRDRAALLACHGVGERKLERYGDAVLEVIRGFVESGDCPE